MTRSLIACYICHDCVGSLSLSGLSLINTRLDKYMDFAAETCLLTI